MSEETEEMRHLIERSHYIPRYHPRFYNQPQQSISALVDQAIRGGIPDPEPPKLYGLAAAQARERAQKIWRERDPADDSGYDDEHISDYIWNKNYKYEEKEFDQYIFNVIRKDRIATQQRKVVVNTATMVRVGENSDHYEMWRKLAKPTLSRAPRKRGHHEDLILDDPDFVHMKEMLDKKIRRSIRIKDKALESKRKNSSRRKS